LGASEEYAPSFSFPSAEKLKNKALIDELFTKGSSFFIYPFKSWYHKPLHHALGNPLFLVTVPKKSFKKAVDRNYIKRCTREAYRLHFRTQAASLAQGFCLGIVYVGKEKLTYKELEKKLILVFNRYIQEINK
jgi:ribonuclease P protein component